MNQEDSKKYEEMEELMNKNRFTEAEIICKELLSRNSDNVDFLRKMGKVQMNVYMDSIEPALKTYNEALALDPNNPILLSDIAMLYVVYSKVDEARKVIQKALEIDGNCAIAIAVQGYIHASVDGNYEKAIELYQKALLIDQKNYRIIYWYGSHKAEMGYLHEGIELLIQADILHPNDINILTDLSYFLIQTGEYEESIKYAQQCLHIDKSNFECKINCATASHRIGDYNAVIEMLIDIQDKLDEIELWALADAYNNLGDREAALNIYKKMIEVYPKNNIYYVWVGAILSDLEDYDNSFSYLNQALILNPEDSYAHRNIWINLNKLGKFEEAKKYLQDHQLPILGTYLIVKPEVGYNWQWLDSRPASKKEGNKFLLACSVDGQQPALKAWEKVKVFSEETLRDPENLWEEILSLHSENEWKTRDCKNIYKLHPFDMWHNRVYDIAKRIVNDLNGDARRIWRKGDPDMPLGIEEEYDSDIILDRLDYYMFGSPKYEDHQIPRMVLGALLDSEQALGPADPKADTHVIRVVGRVVYGIEDLKEHIKNQKTAENIALYTARLISPENPWYVDQQLFAPGALDKICVHSTPKCGECGYNHFCFYKLGLKRELPDLPERLPSLKEFQIEKGIISS